MHIEDGILDSTVWSILTFIGALTLAASLRHVFAETSNRLLLRMGIGVCALFALQMLSMPGQAPLPLHLIGAFALALLLGPAIASVSMGTVILIQALLFQDGGVAAVGANYANMGALAPFAGAALFEAIRHLGKDIRWSTAAAFVCGAFSFLAVALVAGAETAVGKSVPIPNNIQDMLQGSALTALIEGALAAAVYLYFALVRPSWLAADFRPESPTGKPAKVRKG